MWHCAVNEKRKDNDGRAMQYSSISKGLAITGIVFTFVIGTVFLSIMNHYRSHTFTSVFTKSVPFNYELSYFFDLDLSLGSRNQVTTI